MANRNVLELQGKNNYLAKVEIVDRRITNIVVGVPSSMSSVYRSMGTPRADSGNTKAHLAQALRWIQRNVGADALQKIKVATK